MQSWGSSSGVSPWQRCLRLPGPARRPVHEEPARRRFPARGGAFLRVIAFPSPMSDSEPQTSELRRTPLYECHREAGARMVPFAGWEMPVQYAGVIDEHRAVRTAAGLFDVSHMGEVRLRGAGAEALLQRLTPNDVAKLAPGR